MLMCDVCNENTVTISSVKAFCYFLQPYEMNGIKYICSSTKANRTDCSLSGIASTFGGVPELSGITTPDRISASRTVAEMEIIMFQLH